MTILSAKEVITSNSLDEFRLEFNKLVADVDGIHDRYAFAAIITFDGATYNDFDTTLTVVDPTADRTITLPDVTGTVSLIAATETLLNKTLVSPAITSYISHADNVKAFYGTGSDLQIYHDGNNSYIDDQGTGSLIIKGSNLTLQDHAGETKLHAIENGAVTLYHNNSAEKFATTDTGVAVTGDLTATLTIQPAGDTAAGDNAAIGYNSTEGLILTGQGSNSDIILKNDANVTVFKVPTGTDDILFSDNAKAMWGAGSDLQIYHDGSHGYLINNAGNLKLRDDGGGGVDIMYGAITYMAKFAPDSAVTLYHNGYAKIATTSVGVAVTGKVIIGASTTPLELLDVAAGNIAIGNDYTASQIKFGTFGHYIGRNSADGGLKIGGGQAGIALLNPVTVTGNVTATTFVGNLTGNVTSSGTSTFTTVDINGGAIDGTTIGANSASTGAFSTLSATGTITGVAADFSGAVGINGNFDINTNKFTVNATSGNTQVAGTFGSTGAITASAGLVGNVIGNLTGNVTSSGTSTFTTVDINGGAIDGTTIGANSASTGAFSTLTVSGTITGNASSAAKLEIARTINGIEFDGTEDITLATTVSSAGTLTGTTLASNVVTSSLTSVGTLSSLTVSQTIIGNASSAAKLEIARTINGVQFDGTEDIILANDTAAAGTLTGTTLASNVVTSSLTSVGTLSSLTVADGSYSAPSIAFASDTDTGFYLHYGNQLGLTLNGVTNAVFIHPGIRVPSGSQSGPSFAFLNDLDTGIFNPSSNNLGFSVGGAEKMHLDSSGNLGIGTSNPAAMLTVKKGATSYNPANQSYYAASVYHATNATTKYGLQVRTNWVNSENKVVNFGWVNAGNGTDTELWVLNGVGNVTHTGSYTASGTITAPTFVGALSGNATTATKLVTAKTINGVQFDGTDDITVAAAAGTLTGTTLKSTVVNSSLTSVGTLSSLTVSGTITGNASSAAKLFTPITINGVQFDGTDDITVAAAAGTLTGTTLKSTVVNSSLTSVGTLTSLKLGTGSLQSSPFIGVRVAPNQYEFGHPNSGGYGSVIGAESGTGIPFIALHAEAGSTTNTYRTRGIKGFVIKGMNDGALTFNVVGTATADNQTSTEKMRIDNAGNVGIGTSPANKLHVKTTGAGTDGIVVESTTGGWASLRAKMSAGSNNGIVQSDDSGIIFSGGAGENSGNFVIAPWASATGGLRITSAGKVGINNSVPIARLEVRENSNSLQTPIVISNVNLNDGVAAVGFNVTGSSETKVPKAGIGLKRRAQWGRGDMIFYQDNVGDASAFSAGDEVMRLTREGKLGIGTDNPATALDVNGTITCTATAVLLIINSGGTTVKTINGVAV